VGVGGNFGGKMGFLENGNALVCGERNKGKEKGKKHKGEDISLGH